ncbi:MAG: hypothetical protein ACRC6B_10320, partial [Fusobacteriaceae bacterium]
ISYCQLSQDKDQCTKQLLFQLSRERSAPECPLDNPECISAKSHCDTAVHYDTCLIEIGTCSLNSPNNFEACAQEVLCFQGSAGCTIINSSEIIPTTPMQPLSNEE